MRWPVVCSFALVVWGVFTLLALPAPLGAAEADPDEAVLRGAGVTPDDRGLLTFFRDRAGNDEDLLRLDTLVRQLGSRSFKAREEAVERLARLGSAAESALGEAVGSKDREVANRARAALQQIRDRQARDRPDAVVWAALRLLARKKLEGTAESLLRYLPYAGHGLLADDFWWSLDTLAKARSKVDPAVLKVLDDRVPVRRAAVAYLAARRGDKDQQQAARKRLADTDPLVRLRAAQGLLGRGRKEAVPVLIDLLRGTPLDLAWQAEELLHWAAGEQAPEAVVGAGSETDRGRCRDAWRAWWGKRGDAFDLSGATKAGRRPGLLLTSWGSTHRGLVTLSGVWLVGCNGGPRLEVKIGLLASDMHLLPGGRLLLAEWGPGTLIRGGGNVTVHDAGCLTIRDTEGQVLWRYETQWPNRCSLLAGGNLLVAGVGEVTELSSTGQTVWSHVFSYGRQGVPSLTHPQRLPNGNFVGISEPGRGRMDLVETDPKGARVMKQVSLRDIRSLGGRGFRVEVTAGGTYLLAETSDGVVREIDGSGNTVWKSRPIGARDVTRLNDGTLVVTAGERVVEITRAGEVLWEALVPGESGARAARPCLPLVRLGFDAPRPANLDLDTSVEYRLAGLKSRNRDVRRWSVRLLERMGRKAEAAVPALLEALYDPDEEMRIDVEWPLSQMIGPRMLPRLLALAQDKDPRVRVAVVCICGQLVEQSPAVVRTLIQALQDHAEANFGSPRRGKFRVSLAAASSLGNLGPRAREAVPALAAALKSDEARLRHQAAFALGRIGPAARGAIPALKEALNDRDKDLRLIAEESLKKIQR
jgi:HEAT repeat protein